MKETDLFEQWEHLPIPVLNLIDEMNTYAENFGFNYEDCRNFNDEFKKLGYAFDYGLDAQPYNLRKV